MNQDLDLTALTNRLHCTHHTLKKTSPRLKSVIPPMAMILYPPKTTPISLIIFLKDDTKSILRQSNDAKSIPRGDNTKSVPVQQMTLYSGWHWVYLAFPCHSNWCAIQCQVHINTDGSWKFSIGESAPAYHSLYGKNKRHTLSREHSPTHTPPWSHLLYFYSQ